MITKEQFSKDIKKLLIDCGLSERQAAETIGITGQSLNRKNVNASWRYIDFINWLFVLGYKVAWIKRDNDLKSAFSQKNDSVVLSRDALTKDIKKVLVDCGLSEREAAISIGVSPSSLNQKNTNASWRYVDLVNFLDKLGYDVIWEKLESQHKGDKMA